MTNRAINKAIAEFLGWKELYFHLDGKRILGDRPTFSNGKIISYTVDQYVSDYCNDLNLMHEAQKTLSRGQNYNQLCGYGFYITTLIQICYQDHVVDATASQRAKAFVKTIGKWKE